MIKGIGVDLVEIKRIKNAVQKHGNDFLKRIFTDREIEYCFTYKAMKYPELAARFAAKEAYAKANGTGINAKLSWKKIEIVNDKKGKPQIFLDNKPAKKVSVSLSHSQTSAVAFVVIAD